MPNNEVIKQVKLKAQYRPMMSTERPQNSAPTLQISEMRESSQDYSRQTSVCQSENQTSPTLRHVHLLAGNVSHRQAQHVGASQRDSLDSRSDETHTLRPSQVQEVSKTTEEPDAPLIVPKTKLVHLTGISAALVSCAQV